MLKHPARSTLWLLSPFYASIPIRILRPGLVEWMPPRHIFTGSGLKRQKRSDSDLFCKTMAHLTMTLNVRLPALTIYTPADTSYALRSESAVSANMTHPSDPMSLISLPAAPVTVIPLFMAYALIAPDSILAPVEGDTSTLLE